jgi:CBS domain-containing protein
MPYLSQLIGKPIRNRADNSVARLRDVVIDLAQDINESGPVIKALVARTGRRKAPFYIPIAQVDSFSDEGVVLNSARFDLEPFERRDGEMVITKDFWDRQIIDLKQRRVLRVNDVWIDQTPESGTSDWRIVGVDVSMAGLARRLKLGRLLDLVRPKATQPALVSWQNLDIFGTSMPGGVALKHQKLAKMHPVEIARITDAVSYHQGAEIISALDDTLAADTLEEIEGGRQKDLVEQMPDERAADIIEEMAPDEATDLMAELPEDKAGALLEEMDEEEAADVRQLLRYPDHTAGRAMTTDFVCVQPDMTVEEVIQQNRDLFLSSDLIYYMYVTESVDSDELVGVITVRDLLVNERDVKVADFMVTEFLSVRPGEQEREVARKMAEYNLLALPVVNRNNKLLGVITIDDALDSLLPEGWKKRIPRIFS